MRVCRALAVATGPEPNSNSPGMLGWAWQS